MLCLVSGCAMEMPEPEPYHGIAANSERGPRTYPPRTVQLSLVSEQTLGAFELRVRFDTEVAFVREVRQAPGVEYLRWDPREAETGEFKMEGFLKEGVRAQGAVPVCDIIMGRVGKGVTRLSVRVVAAYDPGGQSIQATYRASPSVVVFE